MIFIVTGPIRSGTSVLSRILHQMGVNMGEKFVSPPPGSGFPMEFEEYDLAKYLTTSVLGEATVEDSWFSDYAIKRFNEGCTVWGFKSPFTAFHLDRIRDLYSRIDTVVVIKVTRDPLMTATSLKRDVSHLGLDPDYFCTMNNEIRKACANISSDMTFDYEDLVGDPQQVANMIHKHVLKLNVHLETKNAAKGIRVKEDD